MRRTVLLFHLFLVNASLPHLALSQQRETRPPVIDVHLHAVGGEALRNFGTNPLFQGPPPASSEDHLRATLAEMQKYNVVLGIVGGTNMPG